jgi:malate/lactate dehydrogenase
MRMSNGIMLIGIGDMGYHILNYMAITPGVNKIFTADINEQVGSMKTHHAKYVAAGLGYYPDISFNRLDVSDVDAVAGVLKELNPKVICSTAILWPSYLRPPISEEKIKKLESEGFKGEGPRMSTSIYCALKLMQAVEKSGIEAHTVIANFPDLTNPVLSRGFGLTPTCGGGNVDLVVPIIKQIVSEKLKVPMRNVKVFAVAHHAWGNKLRTEIPYWLKVIVGGDDVTSHFPTDKLVPQMKKLRLANFSSRNGPFGEAARYHQTYISASFLQNILGLYFGTGQLSHAPGPNGLVGGYPVRLSGKGCEVYLPKEITLDEAIKINEAGQKFDGIDQVERNGTIVMEDGSYLEAKDIEDTAIKVFSILKGK